jgi:probable phosphoglycerate mutase
MTKIYLIRHAEAEGNLYRRAHGHYNGDITPTGHRQIALLSDRFRSVPIDAVYASDLQRTQKTANALLKDRPLSLTIEPRLKEIDMGAWEDEPWGNIGHDQPEQLRHFSDDPDSWSVAGCEPFPQLRARMTGVLAELAERHEGQSIACFSHGMAIRAFISGIRGIPSGRIRETPHGDNTCVAEISYSGGRADLAYYNDNSHLPPAVSTFARQGWWREKRLTADMSSLRIIPMDIAEDVRLHTDCYRDSWRAAHGSLKGFSAGSYLRQAEKAAKKDPLALMKAFSGNDFAGIVELDTERGAELGALWISFLYLAPGLRGNNLGVQLVGHAVSVCRRLGRSALRLHVAEENKSARAFYRKLGFTGVGIENGIVCPLLLLEKKL